MVKMSSITAEKYHLKWDSHQSNLNQSVSTLFKNEKYADVMLLTSNPEGGAGVPAHRIILSACSHFFASIFEGNPSLPNSLMYIVLPPELSRRSIQILVQYIYSGEATVSNDILNEVLRGGEILKIRGLCRSGNGSHSNAQSNDSKNTENINYQKNQSRNDCDRRPELHGLGASATAILKESPVIVVSPQVQPHSQPVIAQPTSATPNITVNKEFAIDPDESHKNASTSFGLIATSHLSRITKKLHPVSKVLPKNILPHKDNLLNPEKDRLRRHSEDALLSSRSVDLVRDEILNMCRRISPDRIVFDRIYQRINSVPDASNNETQSETFKKEDSIFAPECALDESLAESLDLLPIKEEPSEWSGDHDSESINFNKPTRLEEVKVEESCSDDEGKMDSETVVNPVYSPLTCELCSETFTHPAEWVRHIESHMDIPTKYIPKKRKRIAGTSTELIASLKCDLCSTQFETPAEWVRHIQNTHTESELAISNNSELPRTYHKLRKASDLLVTNRINKSSNSMWSSSDANLISSKPSKIKQDCSLYLDTTCDICKKNFSSCANMIVHRRSHTAIAIKNSPPHQIFTDT